MELLVDVLKISLPAIVLAITVVVIISKHFKNERDLYQKEISLKDREVSLPLKFQAFERLVLLMERISLNNLLLRIPSAGQNVADFRLELLRNVTHEFEHNLSQQLYVSNACWEKIKEAKNYVLATINTIGESKDGMEPATELFDQLIAHITNQDISPIDEAIFMLKKEADNMSK